jgi:hypothetical protein
MLSRREVGDLAFALGMLFIAFAIATYVTDRRIDPARVVVGVAGILSGTVWRLRAAMRHVRSTSDEGSQKSVTAAAELCQ